MGLIKAFTGSIGGVFADQWKDIITADTFEEHSAVIPGIFRQTNAGRGSNTSGSEGVISNGSKIFVPENTAAFIFSDSGIEEIINEPGGYVYQNGEESIFNGGTLKDSIFSQVKERFGYGGQPGTQKYVAYVNLREIRGIKFGTRGPLLYNDAFYGTDLEITSFGSFSIQITEPTKFVRNYLPANQLYYSFDDAETRAQILSEFLQSFMVVLNTMSKDYRISELPSKANEIADKISIDDSNAGSWESRFGFKVVKVGIQNIEFSEDSKHLVSQYSKNKMNLKAYDDVSQRASDISAQQKIAEGIQTGGLGDTGGMLFGMNFAQGLNSKAGVNESVDFDTKIEQVKKMKELLDAGILTQEEFNIKKKELMGL